MERGEAVGNTECKIAGTIDWFVYLAKNNITARESKQ